MRYSSPPSQPKELNPTIREVDYLAYLQDEYGSALNSTFESAFVKDVLSRFRERKQVSLTIKQELCLRRMVDKYIVKEDYKFLVNGYADRTDEEVIGNRGTGTTSTKMQQAGDDDFEDDIPF